jgi:putative membrane protein
MKKTLFICWIIFAALGLASCKKENPGNKAAEDKNDAHFDRQDEKDADFAVQAASGGLMEVTLGELATKNGSSEEVRKFGQDMIDDHSKANFELKELAAKKGISLPGVPNVDHQKEIDKLRDQNGDGFDNDYINLMVKDHKKDIEAFEKEAANGTDPDMRAWAAGKLPSLRHHLGMAEGIQNHLKDKFKDQEKGTRY